MGSSPPHNYTQGVFSTCRHRAGQWHSLSSHNQHSPTPCFPKLSPITAPVLFSSDICCHQAQELKGSPEDCKILWHALCHEWRRAGHSWSVLLCWMLCWQLKDSTALWRNRHILWATQDTPAALFSLHGIGINTCFVPPVYLTAFQHWNFPLQRADNGKKDVKNLSYWVFMHCQMKNRGHGGFALGNFHPWSVPHIEYQTPHFPACVFTVPWDYTTSTSRNSSSLGK